MLRSLAGTLSLALAMGCSESEPAGPDIIWSWPAATNRVYTAVGKN